MITVMHIDKELEIVLNEIYLPIDYIIRQCVKKEISYSNLFILLSHHLYYKSLYFIFLHFYFIDFIFITCEPIIVTFVIINFFVTQILY